MMAQYWMLAWQLCDFQGIQTSIAKKPYIFVIFQGGSGPPVPPSGSAYDTGAGQFQQQFLMKQKTLHRQGNSLAYSLFY